MMYNKYDVTPPLSYAPCSNPFPSTGPYKWRDMELPRVILNNWCQTQGLSPPHWMGNSKCKVAGITYALSSYGKHC